MTKSLMFKVMLFSSLTALISTHAVAQTILFSDDFETNSAARWAIFGGANAANGNTNDYKAVFATNYTTIAYQFGGPMTNFIPPAPHSTTNTARGLYVTANKLNAPLTGSVAAGVSLYPAGKTFTNNYALRFDLWMDYVGDVAGGGSGSTEFATFGLNHTATKVNWGLATSGDGIWFGIDGEGGTTRDFRTYSGPSNTERTGASGGYYDRNNNAVVDQGVDYNDKSQNNPFWDALPVPPGQSAGAVGKRWVTMEVKQVNNYITWSVNGYVVASGFSDGSTSGSLVALSPAANPYKWRCHDWLHGQSDRRGGCL